MRWCLVVLILSLSAVGFSQVLAQTASQADSASQLYERAMNGLIGSSQSRSDLNSVSLFRRSAEMGYVPAQVVLGYLYETGLLVTKDASHALTWYKKAAQQNDPLAQWLVGRLILAGLIPPRDVTEAAAWLQKSATQGDPFGEYLLGMIRLERQEYTLAAESFQKAAEQGLPQAQYRLGTLLKEGRGVDRDKFNGYVWFLVSSDAGYPDVRSDDLQSLEADLGSVRTEEGKTKARKLEKDFARAVVAHGCTGWPGEFDAIPLPPPPELQKFCR